MKWLVLGFLIFTSFPVAASLGDPETSVEGDFQALGGTTHVTSNATGNSNFTVHDIKTVSGTDIKEYVGADGRIFAITWRGRLQPDLKVLLGGYHGEYQQGLAKAPTHHGHGHERLTMPNIVVEHGGHMRDIRGRAFIPSKFPPGVKEGDIQ